MELLERNLQNQRGVVQREEQRLGVGVDGDAAIRFGFGDATGGLGWRVLDGAGLIAFFDDEIGFCDNEQSLQEMTGNNRQPN